MKHWSGNCNPGDQPGVLCIYTLYTVKLTRKSYDVLHERSLLLVQGGALLTSADSTENPLFECCLGGNLTCALFHEWTLILQRLLLLAAVPTMRH